MTESSTDLQSRDVGAHATTQAQFRALFDAELAYVWKTLRRLGVREVDLADVAHDVFVIVFRRLGDYDASRPIRPWLFGIAYRVARDHRRLARHAHEVQGMNELDVPDPSPRADDRIAVADDQRLVRDALATLEDERRAVFVLCELDGVAMPEVAGALGIPLNTAYSRLRLAREDFRAAVTRLTKRRGR